MPSDQKIEANRRSARGSTSPKTPEGKATVSRNAHEHGLASSRTVVLPEENRQEFEELVDAFRSEYQPQGPLERFLVFELAAADWRLRRIARLETGLISDRLDDLRGDLELDAPDSDPADSEADQQYHQDSRLLGRVFWRNCSGDTFVKLLRYGNSIPRAALAAPHRGRRETAGPAPGR